MASRTWKASLDTKEDLREIANFTRKQWGIAQKNAYLSSILSVFDKIADNPRIGRIRKELANDLMAISAREHIVYYTFDDKHVYIARVLHQRRDPNRLF